MLELGTEECQELWDLIPEEEEQREAVINKFQQDHNFTQAIGVLYEWYEAHKIPKEEWDTREGWFVFGSQWDDSEAPCTLCLLLRRPLNNTLHQ